MAGDSFQVLVFEVGGRPFALPIADVRELLRAVTILPLPHSPPNVEGVINLRGSIVPVFDIRGFFHLPSRPLAHTDHFIVGQAGDRRVALRVNRALDLIPIAARDLEDARKVIPGMESAAWVVRVPVAGAGAGQGSLVLVLNLRDLFPETEPAGPRKGGGALP